jgi:hypothetical protein
LLLFKIINHGCNEFISIFSGFMMILFIVLNVTLFWGLFMKDLVSDHFDGKYIGLQLFVTFVILSPLFNLAAIYYTHGFYSNWFNSVFVKNNHDNDRINEIELN